MNNKIGLLELSSNRWKRRAARRQAAKSKKTNWDILLLEFIIQKDKKKQSAKKRSRKNGTLPAAFSGEEGQVLTQKTKIHFEII